jgi:uncharacterized BrkB/YihY/UPF0761 family membrane protein
MNTPQQTSMQNKIKPKKEHKPFTLMDYIINLFSADEKKYSTIATVLVISVASALYLTFTKQTVPNWLQEAIKWSILGLAGINAFNAGMDYYNSYNGYSYGVNASINATTVTTEQNNPNGGEL